MAHFQIRVRTKDKRANDLRFFVRVYEMANGMQLVDFRRSKVCVCVAEYVCSKVCGLLMLLHAANPSRRATGWSSRLCSSRSKTISKV